MSARSSPLNSLPFTASPLTFSSASSSSDEVDSTACSPPATPSRPQGSPSRAAPATAGTHKKKKRRHRKHRGAAVANSSEASRPNTTEYDSPTAARRASVYLRDNLSDVSLESTALLDHRGQRSMRPRRPSVAYALQRSNSHHDYARRAANGQRPFFDGQADQDEDDDFPDERAPLIRVQRVATSHSTPRVNRPGTSESGSDPSRRPLSTPAPVGYGSVNYPPSVPGSPRLGAVDSTGPLSLAEDRFLRNRDGDAVVNIDNGSDPDEQGDLNDTSGHGKPTTAEEDVCFPLDDGLVDEIEDIQEGRHRPGRRGRIREWPDFTVLDEWSREEKEERSEGIRAKKLPEPVYVGGRLRPPARAQWYRDEESAPFRFTYFNEDLPATIHSHTISELVQPGQTFRDLFRPEPSPIEDSEDEEEDEEERPTADRTNTGSITGAELAKNARSDSPKSQSTAGQRPTFWLDVLKPTDQEMKVLSKAFGIHPLTVEDIMMQETREKVELFRHYYLVSYRTFEQDSTSEDYMEPVNIYVIVFREGVISFHFSMTPHPANVRRRVRQLRDYINVSADWISYALIDDITDAFGPLICQLEEEVDQIDDAILQMHLQPVNDKPEDPEKSDGDMLKRVGDSRRNVMGLYRLMGNKADVIKGFAKRCNEQWEVAPRSEIGLYLGDIQDHIVTMVSNLNHMEKILSRSHANYLAQINIKMNERQEATADVLGKLTVLGTIVLPMNIVTGLWGMNVLVPGQGVEDNLNWFWCITGSLALFGFLCFLIAKRVYGIV